MKIFHRAAPAIVEAPCRGDTRSHEQPRSLTRAELVEVAGGFNPQPDPPGAHLVLQD